MKTAAKALCLIALLTVAMTVGCAPAYHSYSGCYVDCHYCPPPPMPYAHYRECVCHSCAAQPYLHAAVTAPEQPDMIETPQPPEPHELEE